MHPTRPDPPFDIRLPLEECMARLAKPRRCRGPEYRGDADHSMPRHRHSYQQSAHTMPDDCKTGDQRA